MKRILLLFLFSMLVTFSYAQVITGIVLDSETRKPIDFASVFFNGTFLGTTTDELGNFELDISKYASRPLSISAVGYSSATISEFPSGLNHQVLLHRQVYDLEEVQVSTKSLARKRQANLRIFRNEFIGLSVNARKCHILNEEDISFNYGSDKEKLKAYARAPIIIQNLALGYAISYHLECFEFERKSKTMLFTGSIIFNQDLARDEENPELYERRRTNAYLGSCQHFFRALWANSLEEDEFSVRTYRSGESLSYEDLVYLDYEGRKLFRYHEKLVIDYHGNLSYISFVGGRVLFQKDGYFDPTPIIWTGEMSKQRVADFLPYEYQLNNSTTRVQ